MADKRSIPRTFAGLKQNLAEEHIAGLREAYSDQVLEKALTEKALTDGMFTVPFSTTPIGKRKLFSEHPVCQRLSDGAYA
jgi:hypothetical protein